MTTATDTLSTPEAAELIGISRQAVHSAIRRGTLRAERVGRDWRIERAEAERYRQDKQKREANG